MVDWGRLNQKQTSKEKKKSFTKQVENVELHT